jgi:hypothetical protein
VIYTSFEGRMHVYLAYKYQSGLINANIMQEQTWMLITDNTTPAFANMAAVGFPLLFPVLIYFGFNVEDC